MSVVLDSDATEEAKDEFDTDFEMKGGNADSGTQFSMGHPDCATE